MAQGRQRRQGLPLQPPFGVVATLAVTNAVKDHFAVADPADAPTRFPAIRNIKEIYEIRAPA